MMACCFKCKHNVRATQVEILDENGEKEFSFWKFLCACGAKWMELIR